MPKLTLTESDICALLASYPTQHGSINLQGNIHIGFSGAAIWKVDVRARGSYQPDGFHIAKFNWHTDTSDGEIVDELDEEHTRHEVARRHALMRKFIPELVHDSGNLDGNIGFLLYQIAHDGTLGGVPFSAVLTQKRYGEEQAAEQVRYLLDNVLTVWHEDIRSKRAARPHIAIPDLLECLINIGEETSARFPQSKQRYQSLASRARGNFGFAAGTPDALPPEIMFNLPDTDDGEIRQPLPNPFAYALNPTWWGTESALLAVPVCPTHGDLHTDNVMCAARPTTLSLTNTPPWLIDFRNYVDDKLPGAAFDLAMLEFDMITRLLPLDSVEEWERFATFVVHLTDDEASLLPTVSPPGKGLTGAWLVVQPIRDYLEKLSVAANTRVGGGATGIGNELRKAFWLSAMCVGLLVSRREHNTAVMRSAGLFYAARSLRCLLALSGIPARHANLVTQLAWYGADGFRAVPPTAQNAARNSDAKRAGTRNIPQPPALYTPHSYGLQTCRFVGRKAELTDLDAWAKSNDSTLMYEAIGGVGKSALTWQWFRYHAAEQIPNFAGGLWWSFYESDSAMSSFTRHVLAYVTGQPLEVFDNVSREDREAQLLAALRDKPYLLVLDGLERIMVAYNSMNAPYIDDEAEMMSADQRADEAVRRRCTHPADGRFLVALTQTTRVKILISTRLIAADLKADARFGGQLLPDIKHIKLSGLQPADALALMREHGIQGDATHIKDFLAQFGNHSLLIRLVAGKIAKNRAANMNFDKWYTLEGRDLKLRDLDLRQQRTTLLQYALADLDPDHLALLQQIAAFRYPLDYATLAAINPYAERYYVEPVKPQTISSEDYYKRRRELDICKIEKENIEYHNADDKLVRLTEVNHAIAGLEKELEAYRRAEPDHEQAIKAARALASHKAEPDLDSAIRDLEERGLLQVDMNNKDSYDLHPVVRGYTYEELLGDAKTHALNAVRNVFESQTATPAERVKDIHDLRRELEIYRALVESSLFDRASDFYRDNLRKVLHYQLSAFQDIVALLTPLFSAGFDQPPSLFERASQKARITNLANAFQFIDLSIETRLRALNIHLKLQDEDATGLTVDLRNISIQLRDTNKLWSAVRSTRLALRLANAISYKFGIINCHRLLLGCFAYSGRWNEAEIAYRMFSIGSHDYSEDWILWRSEAEQFNIRALIGQNQDVEARLALDNTEALTKRARYELYLYGIEEMRGELALRQNAGRQAATYFEREIEMLRKARLNTKHAFGGLARARLLQGRRDEARLLLDAEPIDDMSAAEVWLSLGEPDKARERALAAYHWAWGEGEPYANWDGLRRARAVLEKLKEPEPALPPFDPDNYERLPQEAEIIAFIEELEAEKAKKDADAAKKDE